MLPISRRHSHYVFGVIQSGLTSLIASGVASVPSLTEGAFLSHWMISWGIAWITMAPVVLLAAPTIRALSVSLTRND